MAKMVHFPSPIAFQNRLQSAGRSTVPSVKNPWLRKNEGFSLSHLQAVLQNAATLPAQAQLQPPVPHSPLQPKRPWGCEQDGRGGGKAQEAQFCADSEDRLLRPQDLRQVSGGRRRPFADEQDIEEVQAVYGQSPEYDQVNPCPEDENV